MQNYNSIFENKVLLAALIAWFLSQGIKITTVLIKTKKFKAERIMGSGGMPSSHSASVMAVTFCVGESYGYGSPIFGACLIFAFIVMYDAAGVRMAAGKQAKAINNIIKAMGNHEFHVDGQLKELLGHTYLEVLVGATLGIIIALLMY